MKILVTGGCGYIGSHVALELVKQNYQVVIADNLSNSSDKVIDRLRQISGVCPNFYKVDLTDKDELDRVFSENSFDAVIHLAGLKAVGESVSVPLKYYRNNIDSTLSLLECMKKYKVRNLVFSSSATVYGQPKSVPVNESAPLSCTNPYGWTKLFIEQILKDECNADKTLNVALLRYFNPIGADKSGLIGECPNDIPNNLAPYILRVATGKLPKINVFGNDYDTPDGTGVRDYIHVSDLAYGHVLALDKLETNCGCVIYNLGTGMGYSVLDVINAFGNACGKPIPYEIVGRRDGDISTTYADCDKAEKELGFKCKYGLQDMADDGWRWAKNNPNGYEEK